MLRFYRYIPAVPKVPPAPQAKPVKNAARNTTFSVTTGARGRLSTTARTRTPADASAATATQKRLEAAAAATRPATLWECAILAEGVTTAVTHGASGHPPATARTPAAARTTAAKLILQTVPAAQQPAPPKRSVRCVVGNTAKKNQITMIWCSTQQKLPPVRKSAGTLTTAASAAAIPPAKSCPHSMIWSSTQQKPLPVRKRAGMLTKPAPVVTIPPMRSCPH